MRALPRRHGKDDGLHPSNLVLGVRSRHLAFESSPARNHVQQALERAHPTKLADLNEKVVEAQVPSAHVALDLEGLVLVDGPLGPLDQGQHIPHPEDPRSHALRVEDLQVLGFLTRPGEADELARGLSQ